MPVVGEYVALFFSAVRMLVCVGVNPVGVVAVIVFDAVGVVGCLVGVVLAFFVAPGVGVLERERESPAFVASSKSCCNVRLLKKRRMSVTCSCCRCSCQHYFGGMQVHTLTGVCVVKRKVASLAQLQTCCA